MFVYHVYAHTMYMYQFSSVAQSCLTLCDPMNLNTPGLPVHHQLPEFTQTHIHRISDAIQPSHPLSSPSLPAPNPSQHQSLFQWVQCICINTHIMANGGGSLEIIFIWHQISSLVMGRSLDIWSLYLLEFSREIELIGDVCSCLSLSIIFISIYLSIWRRQWQPTPVLLPGKSHGRRSLVGCRPWGHEESDIYWATSLSLSCIGEGNGNPLQCSCLENPRDGGAWWAAICGVAQSRTRLKRLSSSSSWERLKAGGERDDRGWDVWMASLTQWTWVWENSSCWWTGRPVVLQSMGSQRDATERLNWTERQK